MGKRKRGRSVKKNLNQNIESDDLVQAPHSFVIHRGLTGGHTLELTKDFRKVMEPFTASSLKERKKNTIKDFVSVAGPLHVSHLSIFSRTEMGMYLKIMRLPRGPTLTFKIQNFSLARDVVSSLKKQQVVEEAFKHSPLIVLNSFSGEGMHLKMMASMFQNMFPTINLTNVDLNSVRRCVLLNYNPTTKMIDFRHYNIKVAPVGISKGVKKAVQGRVPDLSKCNDISEIFTKSGILSESEAEDDPQNQVTLAQKMVARGNIESGKSAIRLSELGPRLTLKLIKIEDGLADGEVLYHDLVHKSEEEKAEIQRLREQKKKLKEKRKKIQEQNQKKKEEVKEVHKEKSLKGMRPKSETTQTANQPTPLEDPVEEDDDREYYRQEVGEEPDKDLFSSNRGTKRKFQPPAFLAKRHKREDTGKQGNSQNRFDKTKFNKKQSGEFGQRGKFGDKKMSENKFGKRNAEDKRKFSGNKFGKRNSEDKRKFSGNKFGKNKGRDKINSQNRDYRPIGGKFGQNRFKRKT